MVRSLSPLTPHNLKRSDLRRIRSGILLGSFPSPLSAPSAVFKGLPTGKQPPSTTQQAAPGGGVQRPACGGCLERMAFRASLKGKCQDKKVRADCHSIFLFRALFVFLFFPSEAHVIYNGKNSNLLRKATIKRVSQTQCGTADNLLVPGKAAVSYLA